MSYFSTHYREFSYPIKTDESAGFRLAQLGAIHSAAGHFVTRSDPGIVTMPTGSGKTAVLTASAFVLRAERVLVLAPSRLVREQIADDIASLKDLREVGAIPDAVPDPKVFSTKKRITTSEEWEELRAYDVVVGTVQSISPEYDEIPEPPADLFDLVLVDEAHHSPARTWKSVLDHFPSAKCLLFTATPFRQDQREIKGRFVFTYDLKRAFEDGVFGEITFQPVTPKEGENHDAAIARAAEQQFKADREAGLEHHLMVRTDSRKRAAELLESLKIAAIHSPHRSLNVTLQFIGRFARVGGENLGRATFLAIPSEIEIEAERLYDTRAVWQEMVQNLAATRVNQEAQTREVLETFEPTEAVAPDLSDLSLYVLEPYYHVKVYQLDQLVDLSEPVDFPDALQVVYATLSEPHNAVVYITREMSLPRWTTDDRLSIVQPDLFIFYQDVKSQLLFICASRRSPGLYEELASSFIAANPRPLPLVRLNRALNDLATLEFFNVGMRNRVAASTTESYRIITGSNADKAILKSDSRLYHRGHVFGRGIENGDVVTIGLSSASKIWSNQSSKLPELIDWCATLAGRIASDRTPVTHSGLDYLDVGEEIDSLPEGIMAVAWPNTVFRSPLIARFLDTRGQEVQTQLLDFDLTIDADHGDEKSVCISLAHASGIVYRATFSFETDRFFEPATAEEPELLIERDRFSSPVIDFLNEEMPLFYTRDLALIHGYSLLRPASEGVPIFDDRLIETVDWPGRGVDITIEFGATGSQLISVHAGLEAELRAGDDAVVYYDHGTGEIADFVAVAAREGGLRVRLYHCKGATGGQPGHRLADVYEIAGQAVKSVTWALKQRILASIRRRFTHNIGSHRFIRGDLDVLSQIFADATPAQIEFEFIAVQPGLRKEGLPAELGNILAAASDHLVRGGYLPLRVMASSVP